MIHESGWYKQVQVPPIKGPLLLHLDIMDLSTLYKQLNSPISSIMSMPEQCSSTAGHLAQGILVDPGSLVRSSRFAVTMQSNDKRL